MKYLCVIIVFCFSLCESQSVGSEKPDAAPPKTNTTSDTTWQIKLDINFLNTLPSVIKREPGSDVRLKCEAVLNFTQVEKYTNNKSETIQQVPPHYIVQNLMKNVKVYWLKNNGMISSSSKSRATTKIDDKTNFTIGTTLRIKNADLSDDGNYSCVIKHNHPKKQTVRLVVEREIEIPTYTPLFTGADNDLEVKIEATPDIIPEGVHLGNLVDTKTEKKLSAPRNIEPICQEYIGKQCELYLRGQFVYIPHVITQEAMEEKLRKALQVTKLSSEISSQCEGYALPSLCYSTFPICRDPDTTNENFMKVAKEIFSTNKDKDKIPDFEEIIPNKEKHSSEDILNYRYNSTVLRRVCKQDCEILETELCQMEYAIAKRHPHIGRQLTLEECQDLPDDDPDCLKIGVGTLMVSDDQCYWESGSGYLGTISTASNGMPCLEWSKQLQVRVSQYPELAGRHSYCRNPGGIKSQPWCVVEKNGKTEKVDCAIPKCAHRIWIYIVVIFLLLTVSIVGFIICVCYKQRNKGNAATISDINLPNADKNIYGNSRMNSPIEMNDLLNNQSMNQPHLMRNTRGNGALRVPQYSLSQIKFLEELGEGAFGKVYKGALKKNGETQYVAVKALKENASTKTKADFRREIDLISELTHDNIVCIVGVALREEPLCMLFEFMARGDLHEFLMGRAPPSGKGLPATRLLNIAHNIASGMQYLASHHYVHRDLAARNCLVSDDFVVKISDFGLSRDIYSSDYYRVQSKSLLPVRWMPPESILYGKFTTESDIWSYGVVLWEIYSYGLQPYYGYSNQEVIAMVRGGELLAAPTACPGPVYALMRDCWNHVPVRRPNFEDIVARIHEWIQTGCLEPETSCQRASGSTRDLQERVPLLPAHCSSSNGSLATGSLKKFSVGSTSRVDDNCSTCSDVPPLVPKAKKHSSGSLIDTDRLGRDTVVRIPNNQFGNEI